MVSIIIPNYNYEKTLPRCMEALMEQTYKNTEIIFVDDGSTDSSIEIAKKYPCRIIIAPSNKGVSAARNTGAKNSSGEIFFFLDSDVALFNNAIENTVREFKKDASLASVCGIYAKEPLFNDSIIEEYRNLQGHYWRKSSEGYVTAGFFSLGAVKRDAFYEMGGFNERLNNSEDIEFGHRINMKYKLLLTSGVVGYHDDEDKLLPLIKKMHERARQRVPFYFHRKKFSRGFETPLRGLGMLAVGASNIMLFTILFEPVAALLFAACIFIFVLSDFGQYKFVRKEKGLLFTCFFTCMHWLINSVVFWGFVRGLINIIFSREFRLKYVSGVKG